MTVFNTIKQIELNKIKKYIVNFSVLSLVFSICYILYYYQINLNSIEHQTNEIIEAWNNGDINILSQNFNEDESSFYINTGFDSDELNELFFNTVYKEASFTIKNIELDNYVNPHSAEVRLLIENYDNMAIMQSFLKEMVEDKSTITYQYDESNFMSVHIDNLKNSLNEFKGSYKDVKILKFTYNSKEKQWELDFEDNYEVLNSMSGNMFDYMKSIKRKSA